METPMCGLANTGGCLTTSFAQPTAKSKGFVRKQGVDKSFLLLCVEAYNTMSA